MERYSRQYRVSNANMDPNFRLSLNGLSLVFQDCFAAYMSRFRRAAGDLRQIGKMWIISEFSIRFYGLQPFWGKMMNVELWISDTPRVKVCADYRLRCEGRVFAEGNCVWAVLDIESRKPQIVTDLLSMIEVEPELALGTRRLPVLKPVNLAYEHIHKSNLMDMDFNHHVSNITYVALSQNIMPRDYIDSHALTQYTAHFLHESFIGDELSCRTFSTENSDSWNCEITSRDRVCCRIYQTYGPRPEGYDRIDY